MNAFTRRWDKVMNVAVIIWMISILPLGIIGIWQHQVWLGIPIGLFVLWILATTIVYDSRWEPEDR